MRARRPYLAGAALAETVGRRSCAQRGIPYRSRDWRKDTDAMKSNSMTDTRPERIEPQSLRLQRRHSRIGWPISRSVSDHPAGYDARVRSGFLARGLKGNLSAPRPGMRRRILPDRAMGTSHYRPGRRMHDWCQR